MSDLLAALEARLGSGGVLAGDDIGDRHAADWSGVAPCRPLAVARPRDDDGVAAVVDLCRAHRARIVVQGGMTGVVGGAVPEAGEIALSLERMAAIGPIDAAARTVIAEAGATIEAVQIACEAAGLLFPLDLGSRGSATVGGVIATNAGGNRVLRYGMTRELVLGLDAVLADGRRIAALRTMLKNNTGLDVKQLLIGSEGTLGIVTRAALRLWPLPAERQVAWCVVAGFDEAAALLGLLERALGGVTAFEAMWPDFLRFVLPRIGAPPPLPLADTGLHILVEQLGGRAESFAAALAEALDRGFASDAVIAQSEAQARSLWAIRDGIGPASAALKPFLSFDIGVPQAATAPFIARVTTALQSLELGTPPLVFGHVGDGNLHLLIGLDTRYDRLAARCTDLVYAATQATGGTISAEHGIGVVKKAYLGHSRTPEEIAVMRRIKAALDPDGVLNHGRILDG